MDPLHFWSGQVRHDWTGVILLVNEGAINM